MNIDKNKEKSDFNTKSLTSIPFGGPIGRLRQSLPFLFAAEESIVRGSFGSVCREMGRARMQSGGSCQAERDATSFVQVGQVFKPRT